MNNNRDHELISRCRKGDRQALGQLVREYERPVFNAAYRVVGSADDAADVTQVVFLKVFERMDQYNPKFKFFSWIYRIAINEAINHRNRKKSDTELEEARFVSGDNPEAELESQRLSDVIQAELMELPEDYRVVVVLRHFSDLSYQEISEVLHIPEKTVKSRLYTARQLMKAQLADRGLI